MPGFAVDFSQVPEREAIPSGEYTLEVVEATLKESQGQKTAGTKMLVLHWKVVGGSHENSRIFDNLLLAGDSLWRTKQAFEAMFGKGQSVFEMTTEELVGARVLAKVTQEVWAEEDGGDGVTRNRIGRYKSLGGNGDTGAGVDALFK